MHLKLIALAVRSACVTIGMQYRDRIALARFEAAQAEAKANANG